MAERSYCSVGFGGKVGEQVFIVKVVVKSDKTAGLREAVNSILSVAPAEAQAGDIVDAVKGAITEMEPMGISVKFADSVFLWVRSKRYRSFVAGLTT